MENKKKIWDYFEESIEYPKNIVHDLLPYNEVWCYVSSTLLNGLINDVEPIGIYAIDRYNAPLADIEYKEENSMLNTNKQTLIELIQKNEIKPYHTDLGMFEDDLIVIAQIPNEENDGYNRFIFFWFDCDCSDCCIGRFKTLDNNEDVLESTINWLEEEKKENSIYGFIDGLDNGIQNYHELPLSFINGWVNF